MRKKKEIIACHKSEVVAGSCKIVEIDGKSIGLYLVSGSYYGLLNRCPHEGAELCAGPVTGTSQETDKIEFNYCKAGELVRCAWHGWEFEIATGKCLVDPKARAKTYMVTENRDGKLVVHI